MKVGHISLAGATVGDNWEHEVVRKTIIESGADYCPDSNDIIVIGGGGLLYDRRALGGIPLEDGWLDRVRKAKKVCAVSIEFGRPLTKEGREVYREILSRCSLIVVRDWESAENVKALCGLNPFVKAPLVFAYPLTYPKVEVRYKYGIVAHFEAGADCKLLKYARDSLMIPFADGDLKELPHEPNPQKSVEVALRSIASCEIIVTSRLHGLIMASLLGKKVVPLLCLPKVRYMAKRLGIWSPFDFLPEKDELDAFKPYIAEESAIRLLRKEAEDTKRLLLNFLESP
jgi:polysaccharide pyruvyl transferase WcaK-like protein